MDFEHARSVQDLKYLKAEYTRLREVLEAMNEIAAHQLNPDAERWVCGTGEHDLLQPFWDGVAVMLRCPHCTFELVYRSFERKRLTLREIIYPSEFDDE